MKSRPRFRHQFVELIPEDIDEGVVYVSIPYASAVHKCCCGCGREVVTPLSPTDWTLLFDGETVSLDPSIGNWNFPCRTHYWIRNNTVTWAPRWTDDEILAGRRHDERLKARHYNEAVAPNSRVVEQGDDVKTSSNRMLRILRTFARIIRGNPPRD